MSKPAKKGTKILIGFLIAAILMAICFLCVALYAKNEFNKERSWLPLKYEPQQASATELPDNAPEALDYALCLYDDALHGDSVEISCRTDVDLGGDMKLPFADADNAIIDRIRSGAAGAVQALYPTLSGQRAADVKEAELPELDLDESDVLEYVYDAESLFNRKGEYTSDTYELVFKIDPAFENADEIRSSSVYKGICEALKDAMTVNSIDPDAKEVEICFCVDRLTDQLQSVSIARSYEITANVTLTDAYAALGRDGAREATVVLPYKATEHIDFMWYGLRFTEDYLEQKPGDIITLPLQINVNSAAVQGEDFTVDYEISDPQTMQIDEDAVMTVNKTNDVSDTEGVKVTATLTFEGKRYTDDIIVYITKLDKATTGVRFWEDSFTVALGKTVALPADIRVPVNEQSEQRSEEEYSLLIEVSDPAALKVEQDEKELFATALKPAAEPVTVTVTMKCGGHTYTASLPVTVTEEAVGEPEEAAEIPVEAAADEAEIPVEIMEETEASQND